MKKWLILLFALLFRITAVMAQTASPATSPAVTVPPVNYSQANSVLDKINTQLASGKANTKQTGDFLQTLTQIQDAVNQTRTVVSDELESVSKKIAALGPAPENGAKEPVAIAKQRQQFTAQSDNLKAKIAQADLIKTRIDEINALILKVRNRELLNNILVKQSSIFHPREFWDSLTGFATFVVGLVRSPLDWYQNLSPDKQTTVNSNIVIVFIAMLFALGIAVYLSLYIKKWFGYKKSIDKPNYSQKVRAGIWMFIARGVIPAAIIGAFLLWLRNTPIVNGGSFGILLQTIAVYLLYYYLGKAVVKVTFTPFNSKWRVIEVKDDKAKSVSSALIFSIAAICIVSFFQSLARQMDYNPQIIYSLKIFANAVKAFCVILVAKKLLYDNSSLPEDAYKDDAEVGELTTSSKISLFVTFSMTVAFALSLLGYIRLSEYIINRFIASAVVIVGFYIIDKLLRVLFHQLLLFKFWIRTFRINRRSLVKTEFWFGLILTPILGILCILVLLAVWGVSVDILMAKVKNFLIGFNIGGMHISITSILLGIITFFIALWLFKLLKNSFITGNLSKIDMNPGVRNSVVSSIGFLGFIVSAILAVAVMGGSFSSIAIIAGALSFGVGLGLQNMVSNLAAGMTILWERPIKIGDWVIINGQEGIVKQINMRSTEIETFSKSHVIIPNSDILSKSVINKTYVNTFGRIEIKVGVGYESNLDLVKKLLLEIAAADPEVLTNPAPSLQFLDLGNDSLLFQVNSFTNNIYSGAAISNRIRENIITKFRENKINIPFPQRVIHINCEKLSIAPNSPPVA